MIGWIIGAVVVAVIVFAIVWIVNIRKDDAKKW